MRRLLLSLALAACAGVSAPALAQQASSSSAMPACSSGDPVVWVNTSTKKYHMQGDSYYGKTKHGKYACKSAADSAGDKAAKMSSSKSSGASAGTNMNTGMNTAATHAPMSSGAAPGTNMNTDTAPSPAPSGMMGHKHHHTASGATSGTNMNTDGAVSPSPVPSGTTTHKHHHHHSKNGASPSPDAVPSPEAS